ncbi:NAD-dependent epimerase/dehydratase family protein [Anaerocolumna sedimenticola]|uniref:NAD-dependent epimerase/dehydratase family protein n=1 Tax=Anaerocolumna sedimenticola TaxID=2696063 RepID=A0A6P1TKU2_9FIRM|nr:NAD-dependent epimerase/dehydratase family protein [Anaerocolumna sedimenticola]QHQ61053.1 NAD-dependent epimerase/dehydratase family protein [Anaerocolumna sedimenticola]
MKKVLVIGAHSYIGQKFKEYVSANDLKDLSVDMVSASDGTWRKVEFTGYDSVLHLSGIVHRKEKKSMEAIYYEVNHKLAVEIANRAKISHVKQFIFMSTAAVYGSYTGCITKNTLPNPTTFYGKSKLAAEQDIIQLQDDEFKVAIVRPPMVYGEGCKGNYPRLVKLAKYTPIFPDFHNKRSMIHINTLLEYIAQLLRYENYGYFHPQDKKYGDTCKIVLTIRDKMGKKTFLIKNFIILVILLKLRINIVEKIFGDFYYSMNME